VTVKANQSIVRHWTPAVSFVALSLIANVAAADPRVCNQSPYPICDQPYDAVAYATTHNAFAAAEISWPLPNQQYWLVRQLEDGVRAFMLDVYLFEDASKGIDLDVYLCHGNCQFKSYRFTSALDDIKTFLDTHPDEVVSIIFESYVHIDELVSRFASVGLDSYLHEQAVGQPWPTLNEMIDSGKRLVVLSDRVDAPRPGYHYVWSFAFETHFSAATKADLNCSRNRGSGSNPLFILNHFLTTLGGSPTFANQINHNPYFLTRAVQCWSERSHMPNFVTVDFYEIGNTIDVVDEINRLRLESALPPATHTPTPTVTPTPTSTPFSCGAAPNGSCSGAERASLRIGRMSSGTQLNLRWQGDVAANDLGDPLATTNYALCLYADGNLAQQLNVPAGSGWSRAGTSSAPRRFSYRQRGGAPDGVDRSALQPGAGRRGRFLVHAGGASFVLVPALRDATPATALVAELRAQNGSRCWKANFSGDVVRLR